MGMFDSIFVAHELLKPLINATIADPQLEVINGYYSFQTKDLDNCLTNFYIKEDGSFCWEKQEYAYWDPDSKDTASCKWSFGEPVGDPQYIADTRTAYINFYDFYYTDQERVFVTFTAHVRGGKLAEPIIIESVEKTNLEEEAIKHKKAREEWNKVTSDWQWQLATFIHDIRFRIRRIIYPLTNKLDELDSILRKQAKKNSNLQ